MDDTHSVMEVDESTSRVRISTPADCVVMSLLGSRAVAKTRCVDDRAIASAAPREPSEQPVMRTVGLREAAEGDIVSTVVVCWPVKLGEAVSA